MADLTKNLFLQKRPRADTRVASLYAKDAVQYWMNQFVTVDAAGLVAGWAGTGAPQGLCLTEHLGGSPIVGTDPEQERLQIDTSGPKVKIAVDGVSGIPIVGDEVVCDTDNLDDSFVKGEVGPTSTVGLGRIDEVLEVVAANQHLCWVQLNPRENYGTIA